MKFFGLTVAVTGEKEENLQAQGRAFCKVITTSASQAGYYPGGEMMTVRPCLNRIQAVFWVHRL